MAFGQQRLLNTVLRQTLRGVVRVVFCAVLCGSSSLLWAADPGQRGIQVAAEGVHRNGLAHMIKHHEPRFVLARYDGAQRMQTRRHGVSDQKAQRSMSEAIAIAKRRVPGEVVSARKQVNNKGEGVYLVKILSRKGVVQTVRVRATK